MGMDAKDFADLAYRIVEEEQADPAYDDDLQLGATERMTDWLLSRPAYAEYAATALSDVAYGAVSAELWRRRMARFPKV